MASLASSPNGSAFESLLDDVNRRILGELERDARISLAELGRRVGLSSPAVGERVARLEQSGAIRGYHADVDPRALGLTLGVVIRSRPAPGQLETVAAAARETPEIVSCDRVTGDDCYVMKAFVRDVEHLEAVIDRFAALGQTTSAIMQSSPVPTRGLLSDDAG
ncbi:Lrp/AsnC family transcriptional regulator [Thermoleophilia bacterium SCSIO 60948]|nr:Lrp/AsnC family transcriptional regulator [Thermoleophilia bacterium SCSIO 60948]